jgi:hypothetical protein
MEISPYGNALRRQPPVILAVFLIVIVPKYHAHLIPDQAHPQQDHIPIINLHRSDGDDGRLSWQPVCGAIFQVHAAQAAPGAVAALHQRRSVEGAQAGQGDAAQVSAFVQANCPAIVELLQYRRRAFNDRDLVIHSSVSPNRANHTINRRFGDLHLACYNQPVTLKDDWKDYKARWAEVEAVIQEERRSASLKLRWQQLNAAYALAKGLGLLQPDPSEMEVFQRWAKLKEKASGQLPRA